MVIEKIKQHIAYAIGPEWRKTVPLALAGLAIFYIGIWFWQEHERLAYCSLQIALWFFASIGVVAFFDKNNPVQNRTNYFWVGVLFLYGAWYHYFGGSD